MTLEEKRDALENWCSSQKGCDSCPCDCDHNPLAWCVEHNTRNIPEDLLDATLIDYNICPVSTVNHPSHYNQGGIECIDAMLAAFGEEAVKNFCLVNAFKYVWRARDKNGMEDIDKAIWYLNKFKELSENA